jgi:Protein of unknown function (DUF1097)
MKADRIARQKFVIYTLIAAVVASVAAWCSATLRCEVWVMFAGFIAWFSRPASWRDGVSSMVCLWLGLGIGGASFAVTGALVPAMGMLALPSVVFVVAIIIVGLRTTRFVNNMTAWFLGMVTFFAAHLKPSDEALLHLGSASLIGGLAGWLCHTLTQRWASAPRPAGLEEGSGS